MYTRVFAWLTALAILVPCLARADVPTVVNYQGLLLDPNGLPVNGTVQMVLRLYDQEPVGMGTALWTETHPSVQVVDGVYNILLGSITSFETVAPGGPDYWMEVQVNGEVLDPRQRITSVLFAFAAADADHAGFADEADSVDGFEGAALDQSGHANDIVTNPHQITAAQTGAATPASVEGEIAFHSSLRSIHHPEYFDSDAVAAMGVKGNPNPLNHDRYQDSDAVSAVLAADGDGSGLDADAVDGIHAGSVPTSGQLLALDGGGKFPNSVLNTGAGNGLDADTLDTLDASEIIAAATDEMRTAISACPTTISSSGSYYLTGDLTSTSGDCITVETNDVTVDFIGYTISGPGSDYGIYSDSRENIEVRNGTVKGFQVGIYAFNSEDSKRHRIINMRVSGNNSHGIHLNGYGHLIKDCTVGDNGSWPAFPATGITVGYGGTVAGSIVYNNVGTGITAGDGSTVMGNTVYGNAGPINAKGIVVGKGSLVKGNAVRECTSGDGIYADDASLVAENSVSHNGNGIHARIGTSVIGNTVTLNTSHGITLAGENLAHGNTAYANAGGNIVCSGACTLGTNHAP